MALRVLDGNQTATTLSSVVTGGEHIVAHSVVSLGANAIANITSAVSGSVVSVSNFPSLQATTFGAITGSVSVLNFPSTQAVTFGQASTTFGAVTGSVSILNFPASQSVTFGQTTVTGQVELGPTSLNALESITVTMGQVTVTGGLTNTELRASAVTIGGTVTASIGGFVIPNGEPVVGETADASLSAGVGVVFNKGSVLQAVVNEEENSFPTQVLNSVTIGSLPAISGTVTANNSTLDSAVYFVAGQDVNTIRTVIYSGGDLGGDQGAPVDGLNPLPITGSVNSTPVPISGTVTANNPSGALTTRFGSVTTANTAQITSAVTNTSRKYLLAQNISAGTVTIGIGFSPTTTQGIQLTAGAGLTFDAFCPTGAVYWLGAVTGANYCLIEG